MVPLARRDPGIPLFNVCLGVLYYPKLKLPAGGGVLSVPCLLPVNPPSMHSCLGASEKTCLAKTSTPETQKTPAIALPCGILQYEARLFRFVTTRIPLL